MSTDFSSAGALLRSKDLQSRLEAAGSSALKRGVEASRYWKEIRKYLLYASDHKLIRETPRDVHRLLPNPVRPDHARLGLPSPAQATTYHSIAVGDVRNFKRDPNLPHFTRQDGAWFDFQLVVREIGRSIEVLAYDFELRLYPRIPPSEQDEHRGPNFVRFDLNPPGHDNEADGRRAHLHLGTDDDGLVVPTPVMSPYEVLDLFLHGLRRTGRKRRLGVSDMAI